MLCCHWPYITVHTECPGFSYSARVPDLGSISCKFLRFWYQTILVGARVHRILGMLESLDILWRSDENDYQSLPAPSTHNEGGTIWHHETTAWLTIDCASAPACQWLPGTALGWAASNRNQCSPPPIISPGGDILELDNPCPWTDSSSMHGRNSHFSDETK